MLAIDGHAAATKRGRRVLKGAAIFAVIALICWVLGFGGLAGAAWGVAKILFWIAVAIAVVLAVLGLTIYKKVT
ncbi:DUF1328 domain-containing protein [Sphingomonas dokdonensis]|uniref:DUF1328 domain-containing protein n=1 Tax=Sphingomonas dokdonensis TaxID=344880 RepID=UPI003CCBFDF1